MGCAGRLQCLVPAAAKERGSSAEDATGCRRRRRCGEGIGGVVVRHNSLPTRQDGARLPRAIRGTDDEQCALLRDGETGETGETRAGSAYFPCVCDCFATDRRDSDRRARRDGALHAIRMS